MVSHGEITVPIRVKIECDERELRTRAYAAASNSLYVNRDRITSLDGPAQVAIAEAIAEAVAAVFASFGVVE